MDCRKARYFLVASFDGPLEAEVRRELTYHLKDCRACRHESFYYRELFSAERQLERPRLSDDFNERLLAEIRIREARAAWPAYRSPAGAPRWRRPVVLTPALFSLAAVLVFALFSSPDGPEAGRRIAEERPVVPQAPAAASEPDRASTPRYAPDLRPAPEIIFRFEVTAVAGDAQPFADQIDRMVTGFSGPMRPYRQEHTRYVLPVVHHAATTERIY